MRRFAKLHLTTCILAFFARRFFGYMALEKRTRPVIVLVEAHCLSRYALGCPRHSHFLTVAECCENTDRCYLMIALIPFCSHFGCRHFPFR